MSEKLETSFIKGFCERNKLGDLNKEAILNNPEYRNRLKNFLEERPYTTNENFSNTVNDLLADIATRDDLENKERLADIENLKKGKYDGSNLPTDL